MKIVFLLIFLCSYSFIYCQRTWFDNNMINCVVLLEKLDQNKLVPHGTGFLVYNYEATTEYYIVTCEHVLRNNAIFVKIPADTSLLKIFDETKKRAIDFGNSVWFRDGKNLVHEYKLIKDTTFVVNKELDIGLFSIKIIGSYINPIDSSKHTYTRVKGIPRSMISERSKIKLGDEIYFLGFPFYIGTDLGWQARGKYADEISNPLLRTGTIAYTSNNSSEFLIDALSYSGNSGSPVFTKQGISNPVSQLVGMVLGHLPSTGSDNMGLARAVWVDEIVKLIEEYKKLP